jgi:hypothetical protein
MVKVARGGGDPTGKGSNQASLYSKYPISSQWEFTLTNDDVVKGEIYCTDTVSDVVVVQDTSRDVRIIAAASIAASKQVSEAAIHKQPKLSSKESILHSKKALEERERRAIRIAQESLKHLNPKVCIPRCCFPFFCIICTNHRKLLSPERRPIRDKQFLTGC